MGASSPMGAEASMSINRDVIDKTLYAVWNDGHGNDRRPGEDRAVAGRTIARAVSTDPDDEEQFRWLVGSAATFHQLAPVRPAGGPGAHVDAWEKRS